MNLFILISLFLIAYLLGSIPFGYLLVKYLKGQDLHRPRSRRSQRFRPGCGLSLACQPG